MPDFTPYPKTPRLFRDMTITEKIDGTNSAIVILPENEFMGDNFANASYFSVAWDSDNEPYRIAAQSRKRFIRPGDDNFAFGEFVWDYADELVSLLGTGRHFGEWFGKGIQRGYDMDHKRFSLFNTSRWADTLHTDLPVSTVPILMESDRFDTHDVEYTLECLKDYGSYAAPGYEDPEGVVVFHHAANQTFKVLVENDHLPKGN